MSRRVVVVVAAVLALVLVVGGAVAVLTSLTGDDGTDAATSRPSEDASTSASDPSDTGGSLRPAVGDEPDPGASEAPDPALETFYSQELSWEDCDDGHECTTLSVPLDYADPSGDTIDLEVLRVPAAQPQAKIGQLVVNPGGPGAPGTSYAASAKQVFGRALLDHFDIVGFDPRGTGGSDPIDCLDDDQLDVYFAEDPDPDTAAEEQGYLDLAQDFGRGCVEKSGDLAGHVSTVEAARDMDVLRAALGRGQLDYFGASYGTKLGATYAQLFPTKVGHLVLDGAVDPSLSTLEVNLQQSAGFETALTSYVQNCVDGGSCFLGDSVEEGLQSISDLLASIDAKPLPGAAGRPLTVGLAYYGTILPLYNRDYWVLLSQALRAAQDGDGSVLLQLADLYASREGDTYSDNSAEANFAINCLDDPSFLDPADVPAELPAFEEAAPTLGSAFAWSATTCSGQQAVAEEPFPTITGAGAAPIVVVGTTRDPATPYAWAVALADQLESAALVSRDGDGHTGYLAGNQCVDTAVEDYLVEDVVPNDGLEC